MDTPQKKLKILAASDLHGDSHQCQKLADQAVNEHVDLVVLCGDLTSPLQTKNLIKPFTDKGKPVLLVPGNHDGFATGDFLAELYHIKNLHNSYATYNHVSFFGCGGANIGLEALNDDEFYTILKKGFTSVAHAQKKIMVTHVHPSGTIVDRIFPNAGSSGVRRAVEQFKPDFLLCGHIHEAAGVEDMIGNTRVINVGRQGKIIEL